MKPRSVQTQNGSTNGDVRDDHAGELVDLARPAERDVERDDQRDQRHHLHGEDHDDEGAAAVEAELRERQRGEEREHERGRDDRADDDQAVLDVVPEVRAADRVAEVDERRVAREPLRRVAEDVAPGLNAVETIQ